MVKGNLNKDCTSYAIDLKMMTATARTIHKSGVNDLLDLLLRVHSPQNDTMPIISGVLMTEIMMKHFKILVTSKKRRAADGL